MRCGSSFHSSDPASRGSFAWTLTWADFACRRARLVVEIDGSQHAGSTNDRHRTAALEAAGWQVMRFWNPDVQENIEGVTQAIMIAGNRRLPPGESFMFAPSRAGRERKPRSRK